MNRAYEQIENEVTRRVSIEDRYDSLLSTVQGLRGEVDNVFAGLIGCVISPDSFRREEALQTDENREKISPVGRGDHIPGQGRSRVGMEHTELQAWAEGHQHRMKEGTNPAVMEQAVGGSAREAQSRLEDKVEEANRIIAQLLEIANTYRTTYHEASKLARDAVSLHSKHHKGPGEPHATPKHDEHAPDEPSPYIDPSDPTGAIDTLRAFDHDEFLEEIKKTGSTIRKWQKQCKEYRERGKTKISFRNFSEGDLALFLPTRNKLSKPWAAFNGTLFVVPFVPFRGCRRSVLVAGVLTLIPHGAIMIISLVPALLPRSDGSVGGVAEGARVVDWENNIDDRASRRSKCA